MTYENGKGDEQLGPEPLEDFRQLLEEIGFLD
jgi:hypothetical protein